MVLQFGLLYLKGEPQGIPLLLTYSAPTDSTLESLFWVSCFVGLASRGVRHACSFRSEICSMSYCTSSLSCSCRDTTPWYPPQLSWVYISYGALPVSLTCEDPAWILCPTTVSYRHPWSLSQVPDEFFSTLP